MREALRSLCVGSSLTVREVFERLDEDGSGYLDRREIDQAAGQLGGSLGVLMTAEEQEKAFRKMDPDGDGQVTFAEFEVWWKVRQLSIRRQ